MNAIWRLRELEASATPGPWQSVEFGVHAARKAIAGQGFLIGIHADGVYCDQSDADLIAEMRNALPKLLAFVEAYDLWLELFMQDGREDLEDETLLGPAVQKLDAARKDLGCR